MSTDHGDTWTEMNEGLSNTLVNAITICKNDVFAGTSGGGVFQLSSDTSIWTARNEGLANVSVNAIVMNEGKLFAGSSGGVWLSEDEGASWANINNGLANSHVMSLAANENILYAGTQLDGAYITTNNGGFWVEVKFRQDVRAIAINKDTVFLGIRLGGIYKSTDFGNTWIVSNDGLTDRYVMSLAIHKNYVFAGTYSGVFVSDNYGTSWTLVAGGPSDFRVDALLIIGEKVYAGTDGGGVFMSSDYGINWTEVNDGLESSFVLSLDTAAGYLYAGTESGIFYSPNQGTRWINLNDGIMTGMDVLAISASEHYIVAGTYTGLWKRLLSDLVELDMTHFISNPQITLYPNPSNSLMHISSSIQFSIAKIYDVKGNLLLRNPISDNRIDIGALSAGLYILKLENNTEIVVKKFLKQ